MSKTSLTSRLSVPADPPRSIDIVGVARTVRSAIVPLNGMRHPRTGDTCGWYLWAGEGEPSVEPNFFEPVHFSHVVHMRPEATEYFDLPPGYRFLIAPGYEDVWFDESLLII